MNFPSTQFSDTVSDLCFGNANDRDIAELHETLRSNQAARDDYLWQVELHSRLAQTGADSMTAGSIFGSENSRQIGRRLPLSRINGRIKWTLAAAALMIAAGGLFLALHNSSKPETIRIAATAPAAPQNTAGSPAGIYRETVRFAIAADAPVIVGTGRSEPIALGAEVPYTPGGDTLHVWDWSKSPTSRVMKDIRLWPTDVFAVSPDGKTLVIASGKIVDLATGELSKIDLGDAYYSDDLGGTLQRIVELHFTPDGRHLALRLSNIVLEKSTHPLRKQDFSTTQSLQIISYPAGKLVCEFPAGLRQAFSPDGQRAVTAIPHYKPQQQIFEYSTATGEVLRKYEPHLREFAYAQALSPDATRVAVFDSAGELLIWDSTTGELKHRVHIKEGSPADLRFSPDGKLLAISLINKTSVIDVASGAIVAALPQSTPGVIRWSPDNQAFDIISSIITGTMTERNDNAGQLLVFNVFPELKHWKIGDVRKK